MIKIVSAAIKHPQHRSQQEFQQYWTERHGPLFARTPQLRRYVQHHSLPEAQSSSITADSPWRVDVLVRRRRWAERVALARAE